MEALNLYVKQDGMYNTLDILITFDKTEDLPKDWYLFETGSFKELVKEAYIKLFDNYCSTINVSLEDNYTLDMNDIKYMIPEVIF